MKRTKCRYSQGNYEIVIGSDHKTHIYDTRESKEQHYIKSIELEYQAARSIAYSPDGKYIAIGGCGETIMIYESVSGKHLNT
jgi:WD40 repeat protein